jgi:hypothetical protein
LKLTRVELSLYAVSVVLALFLLSHLARPCELRRWNAVWEFPEFEWQNTVILWTPEEGCVCRTLDDDPWVLREKDQRPERWSVMAEEYPRLTF